MPVLDGVVVCLMFSLTVGVRQGGLGYKLCTVIPVAGQRTHGTTSRELKVTFQVATPGAESAVYDCLVYLLPFTLISGCLRDVAYVTRDGQVSFQDRGHVLYRMIRRC